MIRNISVLMLVVLGVIVSSDKPEEGPLLSSFRGLTRENQQNPDGSYHFFFTLPQQERQENRDADGKVEGYFAFVDKSGEEFSLHFDADEDGYQPESDDLPQAPEETEDVQNAREQFLRYYEQTAKFLEELGSEEDSESSSEEDYSYEESYEDSSSEEDSDEESESESEEEESARHSFFNSQRKSSRGFRSRNNQQVLSRSPPTKQRENPLDRSVFPPIQSSFSAFGRRT